MPENMGFIRSVRKIGVCLVFKFIIRYANILNETALHQGLSGYSIFAFFIIQFKN